MFAGIESVNFLTLLISPVDKIAAMRKIVKTVPEYDVAIIGAGHNGLVAANYLSDKQVSVILLEASKTSGGAAGVRRNDILNIQVPTGANWAGMLSNTIVNDLELRSRGLEICPADPQVSCVYEDGNYSLFLDEKKTVRSISNYFGEDEVWSQAEEFQIFCEKIIKPLRYEVESPKPSRERFESEVENVTGIANICTLSPGSILRQFFDNDKILGALSFGPVSLSNADIDTVGTSYALFHMMLAEIDNQQGLWGFYSGGTQALIDTLVSRLNESPNVEIRNSSLVESIEKNDSGFSVNTANASCLAKYVVSSLPKSNTLSLLDKTHTVVTENNATNTGKSGQVWFLLNSLPEICVNRFSELRSEFSGIIQICPSATFISEAINTYKTKSVSTAPLITCSFYKIENKWLLSCYVQFVQHAKDPSINVRLRKTMIENVRLKLESVITGFDRQVHSVDGFTPRDLELELNLPFGHPEHTDMTLDAIFQKRGGNSESEEACKTPIQNLFLCGASVHPGGNLTGLPGKHAAQTILKELKK